MDKGAHFYKCDFQVHTPRDLNWTGRNFGVSPQNIPALVEEQKSQILSNRRQFSKEYLDKIRTAGINAVAITDHHDVVFAKTIRAVALEESAAFSSEEKHKSIIVFPGIELTLANPSSQCLLIFDANFEDAYLDNVLAIFGVTLSSEYAESTEQTQRISQTIISDLVHLHKKLDELSFCKGRYVVLPNVSKAGHGSILRSGFQEHYIKMPCSGNPP